MKLGTVLATMSTALLLVAQPAVASRSYESLPSVGAPGKYADARRASRVGQSEDIVGMSYWVLGILFTVIAVTAAVILVEDDNGNVISVPTSP